MKPSFHSLLSATTNTRDLGGHLTASGQRTACNRIWRSDAPRAWNAADDALLRKHGITAIIDLRTREETEKHPCAYAETRGFAYHHFPITAGSVPPSTLEEVPLSYMEIAAQKETAAALIAIAEADRGTLFCCTAGKDRTGVIAAILLSACGVDQKTIIEDYAVSREYNRERLEKYLAEHPEVKREVVLANEKSMERFLSMLLDRYGSVESYFSFLGLSCAHLDKIRHKLLE